MTPIRLHIFLKTLGLLLVCSGLSCSDFKKQKSDFSSAGLTDENQLAQYGMVVARRNTAEFKDEALAFRNQLQESCSNTKSRDSYLRLLKSFYHLNSFAVAHLQATEDTAPLTQIYSNLLNMCLVDIKVLEIKNKISLPADLDPTLRGLHAIEYLLFNESLNSTCNVKKYPEIVTWNQLADAEKRQDRCNAAISYADLILQQAQRWDADWQPESANYTTTLSLFGYTDTANQSVKNMIQALFKIEKIKDFYLGEPLGLNALCTSEEGKCLDQLPHPYSEAGFYAIQAAMDGFQKAFNGTSEDFSVAAFLTQRQHPEIVDKINRALADAERMALDLEKEKSLQKWAEETNPARCKETTIDNPLEPLCVLFKKVELVTDIFKSDILTLLSLELATSLPQGDND